jgi:hypothetical protein
MIGRRGALGALMGAPVLAKQAIEEGVAMVAEEITMPAMGVPVSLDDDEDDLWDKLPKPFSRHLRKMRRKLELRYEAKTQEVKYMPACIAERKSWSTEFKRHVWSEDELERSTSSDDLWRLSPDELIAVLVAKGFKVDKP